MLHHIVELTTMRGMGLQMYTYTSLMRIEEVQSSIKRGICEVLLDCELVGIKRKFSMLMNHVG